MPPQRDDERPRVLVVDDDPDTRDALSAFLTRRGFDVSMSDDLHDALQRFETQRPTAVILDLDSRPDGGLDALPAMKRIDRDVPIIATSHQGRTTTIVRAIKLGAADFITKPLTDDDLDAPLENALRQRRIAREVARLRQELQAQSDPHLLFGCTPCMADVAGIIQRVADTDATILLRGASGTGKELAARAIHQFSGRCARPLVKVNCAALPADLLESELFGYERGAFAAANQPKPGKFEFANHGTLFLDEIGGMSAALQQRLVCVLDRGEFTRIGGQQAIPVDVRLLAATNRDLERAVADGQFLPPLFAHLSPVTIRLPELRERRDEIPTLTQYFLKKYSVHYNKPLATMDEGTMQLMLEYDWPGNVRELENLVKRFVVFGNAAELRRAVRTSTVLPRTPSPLDPPAGERMLTARPPEADRPAEQEATDLADIGADGATTSLKDIARAAARRAERVVISRMLIRTHWNRKEAAESLGISYKALLYKIKENGLDKAV